MDSILLELPADHVDRDLPYLPLPNRCEVVLTDVEPPSELTRTAFVLPFTDDGDLLMSVNQRRGLDIPGGHVEPGEDARAAGIRETLEETGCVVADLVPVGFLRMVSEGEAPEGWRYPHPVGFQQFFAARVVSVSPFRENDECAQPRFLSPEEAAAILKPAERVLAGRGRELVLGIAAGSRP